METRSGGGVIYTKNPEEKRRGMKLENPFTLKVGRVFTGFGIGCGIGIGVGRPLNLGAIPVLNQVIIATRGATDAFSGVQRHVNSSLRKVGAKNIEAGIGCGVGFGHGFGVGLAVKPAVLHQIQSQFLQVAKHMMTKLGVDPSSTLSVNQSMLPESLQTGMSMTEDASLENHVGIISQSVNTESKIYEGNNGKAVVSSKETSAPRTAARYSSRTENVLNNFLANPLPKVEGSSHHEQAGALQLENNVLQMLLKHQILIEQLMHEHEQLRHILLKELKVQPSKLQSSSTSRSMYSCTECFECRRKQRRR